MSLPFVPALGALLAWSMSTVLPATGTPATLHLGSPGTLTTLDRGQTWRAGTTVRLDGPVLIGDAGTLRIEAGTRIEAAVGAYLILGRESRVEALGTVEEPIVMTCTTAAKYPGCWGGVIVQGNARINNGTANSPSSERSPASGCLQMADPVAAPAQFGGCNDEDNSGILRFLRIEYAERGLHLAGVGSGTTVHSVQANRSRNDGVLITGGTVAVRELFLTANGTGLRWTGGWRGAGQFIAVQQDVQRFASGITGQNGVTATANPDATPRSAPQLFNLTVLAQSDPANPSHGSARALVLERGTAGTLRNLFFYAPHIALDIAGSSTCTQFNSAALSIEFAVTAGATSLGNGAQGQGCSADEGAILDDAARNTRTLASAAGQLVSQNDLILPDLRPVRNSALALNPAATPAPGSGLVSAPYVGAIPVLGPGGAIPWFSGWTSPAPTPAPIPFGTITGVVRSPFRGILGNTVVTDDATGATTTADASGRYTLSVPAGTALLSVTAVPAGCPVPDLQASTVQPNATTTFDLRVDCPPLPGTRRISAGSAFACAIADGGTHCWGDNARGQLGNGSTTPTVIPAPVAGAFTSIAAGATHTCGIEATGTLRCWGANTNGQLGTGTTQDRSTPAAGPGGPFVLVAAGGRHTCALGIDGRVFCWGANDRGQLGIGTTIDALVPREVTGIPAIATLAAGTAHTCALDITGATWCWGSNDAGQLGDGTTTQRLSPVRVVGARPFRELATGVAESHNCGTDALGDIYCWGDNSAGQLGTNGAAQSLSPARVSTPVPLKDVILGRYHTCAIGDTDARSYCWGNGASGQIGDGFTINRPVPTAADASARFNRLMGGDGFSCGVTFGAVTGEDNVIVISRRSLLCWGDNSRGQFGRGNTTSTLTPAAAANGLTIP